jgi:head-tail adaptor
MPLSTRIGSMRESLALQRNTVATSTGTGFSTDGWATYATVPGEYVQPSVGREAWEGAAVTAELPTRFRIRDRSDVEPKHRLLWKGATYEIHAVIPVMTVGRRFLFLDCGVTQ